MAMADDHERMTRTMDENGDDADDVDDDDHERMTMTMDENDDGDDNGG